MAYSLPDGTKIDQVIWDNKNIKNLSPDYIMVPALYTGRLKIIIIANDTVIIRGTKLLLEDLTEYELKPTIKIDYYSSKNKKWLTELYYIQISTATYPTNYIITEFNIPSRYLINRNIYNAYYIKIYLLNLDSSASSGNISAYLIWE